MTKNSPALEQLEQQWREIFSTLQGGGEVSPALRLRTEGFMQALIALDITTITALQARMGTIYIECFQQELPDNWQELFPFPQIPGFGLRAPVYPSTRE